MSTLNSRPSEKYAWAGELRTVDIRDSGADWLGVRPTMVMVSVVGLALKDHGRARTLKGLRAGDAGGLAAHRPAMLTLPGPCPAMVL